MRNLDRARQPITFSPPSRREFLKLVGAGAAAFATPKLERSQDSPTDETHKQAPDYRIRIENGQVEVGHDRFISTTTYNGQFPGPLVRLREGRRVTVDIENHTDTPEQLHWHGQRVPVDVDGAAEEGTPFTMPGATRRISFIPQPSGLRFYHTHVRAGGDMNRGQYTGQVGPVYIEPESDPGRYDREVFLTLKEFEPWLSHGGDMPEGFLAGKPIKELRDRGESAMDASLKAGNPRGFEVNYRAFTINGRMLGHGEPVRVREGERVLFHVLNGSATEIRNLALPGHIFTVVAMDGNPIPKPVRAPVLWLGTAERISALVAMNHPGIWILGDTADDDRHHGMGVVVEYAGQKGKPQWLTPPAAHWNYPRFGNTGTAAQPDEVFDMTFEKQNAEAGGFNRWTINGTPYPDTQMMASPLFHLKQGRRYRLRMRNASDDIHPIHLHRHSFELTRIAGQPASGVMKDVVMLGGYQEAEIDFVADNPGMTLFHCHQQLHMDFGFMVLFDYV